MHFASPSDEKCGLEKGTASQFPFDETLFLNGLRREKMGGRRLLSRPFSPMDRLPGRLDIENDSSPLVPL